MKIMPYYLFVLIAIFTTTALSAELLTNPGFESDMTGWTVSSSNGWPASSTTAHSGAKSTNFTVYDTTSPYSAYVLASQRIAHNGSNEYTFSVYARDNWPSTSWAVMHNAVIMKLEYYNSSSVLLRVDQLSNSIVKDLQWHQYFLTGTNIPAGTVLIKPVIGTVQNDQWCKSLLFDDASLTGRIVQAPAPHTADLNNDLQVNFADFALLAEVWMQTADWEDLYLTSTRPLHIQIRTIRTMFALILCLKTPITFL
jgi:hypothetical protein